MRTSSTTIMMDFYKNTMIMVAFLYNFMVKQDSSEARMYTFVVTQQVDLTCISNNERQVDAKAKSFCRQPSLRDNR